MVAYRSVGVDEIATQENVRTLLEDMLREVDLYGDDIELLGNRFVSPLSRLAPDFYKFYLVDTVAVDGDSCVALAFIRITKLRSDSTAMYMFRRGFHNVHTQSGDERSARHQSEFQKTCTFRRISAARLTAARLKTSTI